MTKRPIDVAFESHMMHERLAKAVTRSDTRRLVSLAALLVLAGLGVSVATSDFMWFARSGAALATVSLALAVKALNFQRATELLQAAQQVAGQNPDADTWGLLGSVHRQYLVAHLFIGAVGTLIWGFGDLLGYLFHGWPA